MSESEKQDALAAVELLRQAAHASYDDANADPPAAGLSASAHGAVATVHGLPRYLVFMACEGGMFYLMRRVWGFTE